jgi:predicted Zn-dependent protease/tetratricopeptide (TPR) repeat protein
MSEWSRYMPIVKGELKPTLLALVLMGSLCFSTAVRAETLSKLIDRANQAVAKQDNLEAISLYEQAVQKSPNDKALKKNLAVLYANYGVTLQEKRDYDAAIQNYDKALSLAPVDSQDARNILDAKAGALYSEAMDMRDLNGSQTAAGPASGQINARMQDLLEQAIALKPEEPAFKKGLATMYLDQAYNLATAEKYAEAAPLLEQAMAIDNQSPAIKQSLANVYLGLARNDELHRKEWIDKALAVDNSDSVKQAANILLAPPIVIQQTKSRTSAVRQKKSFATPPGEIKSRAPRDLAKLSVVDMLKDMENQLGLDSAKKATLEDRLEVVEKQVMGGVKTGPVAVRAKEAYVALMGSTDGVSANSLEVVQAPLMTSEDSYLDQIFKVTDGKVVRWGKFPLRVYVEAPKDTALFKPEYKEAALRGLNIWKDKTSGFANYVEVKNPQAADITITWTDQYVDRFADLAKSPDVYKNFVPPKRTPFMQVLQVASMLTPGYFSLAPQALGAAVQYKQNKKLEVIRDESAIKLGLAPTKDLSPEAAQTLIQNMAAKEFGHALGLKGSSTQQGDLLYPELKSDVVQLPSPRDLETLRELYDRPANIVLNVH